MVEDVVGLSLARASEVQNALTKATKADVEMMLKSRPHHPLTLQCANLFAQQLPQKPVKPLEMLGGHHSALQADADPAQAVQHLLHCMYFELMVCLHGVMAGLPADAFCLFCDRLLLHSMHVSCHHVPTTLLPALLYWLHYCLASL